MFIASATHTSQSLHAIPGGVQGIFTTVGAMRAFVNKYKSDPYIRNCAANLTFLTPEKSDFHEAITLYEYCRDNIKYVRDICGIETLTSPDKTIQCGYGDCDDQSLLLATLAESIGIPSRFVIAGYSDPKIYEHVYVQLAVSGEWVDCDPTEHQYFGYAPPSPVVLSIEKV